MEEILKYPLTPVPLSLSHADGTMQKTVKVKLSNELQKRVKTVNPTGVDVTVIDGLFFLHFLIDLPTNFGSIASFILHQVCKQKGHTIHLVFDKTISPSIKDCERDKRSDNRAAAYHITGPEQKRPGNWLKVMRQDQFKEALIYFLIKQWEDHFHQFYHKRKCLSIMEIFAILSPLKMIKTLKKLKLTTFLLINRQIHVKKLCKCNDSYCRH